MIRFGFGRIPVRHRESGATSGTSSPTPATSTARYVKAPAYGAPDPNGPGVPGALNNYVLAGTQGGHGSTSPSPAAGPAEVEQRLVRHLQRARQPRSRSWRSSPTRTRGSHEAYAVSSSRVYHGTPIRRSGQERLGRRRALGLGRHHRRPLRARPTRRSAISNLVETLIQSEQPLTSIVADWRYVIPDVDADRRPTRTRPRTRFLYVSGQGGVAPERATESTVRRTGRSSPTSP